MDDKDKKREERVPAENLGNAKRSRNPRGGRIMDDAVSMVIPISAIDMDAELPSLTSEGGMERHIRCVQLITESLDKIAAIGLGRTIMYPILVSQREDVEGRFWLIDGWGRVDVAKDVLEATGIHAMVLPPIDIAERIQLRLLANTPPV